MNTKNRRACRARARPGEEAARRKVLRAEKKELEEHYRREHPGILISNVRVFFFAL
jgi:hypothetical protein